MDTFLVVAPDPTAAPTEAPTVSPTVAPSAAPTAAPTEPPTVAPTATPVVGPTVAPTAAPTAAPTVAPTAAPTVAHTVAPTASQTEAPTVAPTVSPSRLPTLAPSAEVGAPLLVFDSSLDFSGVSAAAMEGDSAAQDAAVEATATSFGNGVTVEQLQYVSATDITRRALAADAARRLVDQCSVTVRIVVPVEQLGTDSDAAYVALTGNLSAAVSSGAFDTALATAAIDRGATSTLTGISTAAVSSGESVVFDSSDSPTVAPSTGPESSGGSGTDMTAVWGGVAVGVIIVFCAAIAYYHYMLRNPGVDSVDYEKPGMEDNQMELPGSFEGEGAVAVVAQEEANL